MLSTIVILLACAIPTTVYVGVIYWVDRYEKEPTWLLSAVFLWGAIPSIVIAIIANRYFSAQLGPLIAQRFSGLTTAAVVAPLVEETVKGLALIGVLFFRRQDIDSPLDGIIYGAMVGMGFAMVENWFYFSAEFARGGLQALSINVFYRAIVFGLNHALFSATFGFAIAVARLTRNELLQIAAPALGWAVGVTLHAIHNATVGLSSQLCLIAPISNYSGLLLTGLIIVWSLRREHQWLSEYLKEEVVLNTVTFRQYELASNVVQRRVHLWDLFTHLQWLRYRRTRRLLAMLSKLAYHKHHAQAHPSRHHDDMVEELRQEIYELGHSL